MYKFLLFFLFVSGLKTTSGQKLFIEPFAGAQGVRYRLENAPVSIRSRMRGYTPFEAGLFLKYQPGKKSTKYVIGFSGGATGTTLICQYGGVSFFMGALGYKRILLGRESVLFKPNIETKSNGIKGFYKRSSLSLTGGLSINFPPKTVLKYANQRSELDVLPFYCGTTGSIQPTHKTTTDVVKVAPALWGEIKWQFYNKRGNPVFSISPYMHGGPLIMSRIWIEYVENGNRGFIQLVNKGFALGLRVSGSIPIWQRK
jgi:hypothetical protein